MSDRMGGMASQMDSLKQQFDTQASNVDSLIATLDRQVDGTIGEGWFGAKADEFKSNWYGQFKPALTRLRDALLDNSNYISQKRAGLQQWDT